MLARGNSRARRSYSRKKVEEKKHFSPRPLLYTYGPIGPMCRCARTFLPKLHAACKMDFEQLTLADGVKVSKQQKIAYILLLLMVSICTFETLNEIVHFRAVTLSTVLSTMSFKTIRLVQTIKMHSRSKVFFFMSGKQEQTYLLTFGHCRRAV